MYEGDDRRKMNSDWIERDRLLSEVHSDVKHIAEWAKKHDGEDIFRFAIVTKEIEVGKKVLWGGIGIMAFIEIVTKFFK